MNPEKKYLLLRVDKLLRFWVKGDYGWTYIPELARQWSTKDIETYNSDNAYSEIVYIPEVVTVEQLLALTKKHKRLALDPFNKTHTEAWISLVSSSYENLFVSEVMTTYAKNSTNGITLLLLCTLISNKTE